MEGSARGMAIAAGFLATIGAFVMGILWVFSPAAEREEAFGGLAPANVSGYSITTTFTVDEDGVRRSTTVETPGQPKAVQAFHEGRIDGPALIHELGADLGVRDDRTPDDCFRTYNLTGTTIETETHDNDEGIPETTVRITEVVHSLLSRASHFRVCFPAGMPGEGATGSVEVVVHDFDVLAVRPTSDGSAVAAAEKRYSWDRVDGNETISIDLQRPALAFLGQLPGLSVYSLIPGTAGQLLAPLLYLILASIPSLLLLWALRIYREDLDVPARSIAEGIVLLGGTLAVAPLLPLLFSPLVEPTRAGLAQLGANVVETFGVPFQYEFDALQAGLYIAGLLVAIVVVLVARMARNRPLSWLSSLVTGGIVLQLAIMLAGAAAIVIATPLGGERVALRLAVWLVSAFLVGLVLWILTSGLQHVATGRLARWLRLSPVLIIPLALWLGIPLEDRVRGFRGESLGEYAFSVNDELFALSASSEVLLLVAAVVAAWGLWHRPNHTAGAPLPTWEDALDDASTVRVGTRSLIVPTAPVGTRAATIHALARAVFAGLLIGKVGVIAGLPLGLVAAFFLFPFVFSPLGTTAVLAAVATRLRDYRVQLTPALLALEETTEQSEPEAKDTNTEGHEGGVVAAASAAPAAVIHPPREDGGDGSRIAGRESEPPSAAAWRRGLVMASPPFVPRLAVLSLGPSASPWQNAVRSTRYGVLLQLVPLFLYIAFFLPMTLSSNDPRLWLELVSKLTVFVAGWAALAFFFGLFYEHLAEPTGLRKGLRFGLLVLAITLPWSLLAASQGRVLPSVVAFDALELVLFVAALGLLFDLAVLGVDDFQLGKLKSAVSSLTATSGLRPVAVFVGGLLTAAAVAIVSLLQGQIAELVSSVLSPFLPLAAG